MKNKKLNEKLEVKSTLKNKKPATQKEVSNWENDGGNNIAPLLSAEQALKQAREHQQHIRGKGIGR